MTLIFENYFLHFIHPFKTQEAMRMARQLKASITGHSPIQLADETHQQQLKIKEGLDGIGVSYYEAMGVSWIFIIVKTIYALVAMGLGVVAYNMTEGNASILEVLIPSYTVKAQKILIIMTLAEAVFFPLGVYVYAKIWETFIRFFGELFNREENLDQISSEIVAGSLTSHLLLVVPVFGALAQFFASLIFLYAGLRRNLELKVFQAIMVLIAPVFVVFLLWLALMVSVLLLVSIF